MTRKARKTRFARRLRKHMTEAESVLWNAIRNRKCGGMKFRRQVPIAWYVVDFVCLDHSLVLEVDGGIHDEQQEYDKEREEDLHKKGYRVLRFKNEEVLSNLPVVLRSISDAPLSWAGERGGRRGAGGEVG